MRTLLIILTALTALTALAALPLQAADWEDKLKSAMEDPARPAADQEKRPEA